MNHSFRLIWSRIAQSLIPVPENARGQGKASGRVSTVVTGASVRTTFPLQCMALAVATAFSGSVYALPQGGQVASGTGAISQSASSMTVQQSSPNLAINWQSFGIAAGEAVQFKQPSASSIVLNRVLGQDPSRILGSLSANGQVFISNPSGILFAAGAQVNVGGLVATSLAISDADFAAGNYSFSKNGSAGVVTNQGSLTAADGGYIALLAPEVRNEGTISAKLGKALLAAGDQVTLTLDNGSLIGYNIDQGAVNALADNRHLIKADGGQVILSARAADALARSVVNSEGVIEAHTIDNQGGVIRLVGDEVRHGNKLDASAPGGGKGGTVQVDGDLLVQTGSIDVNGAEGGSVTVTARRMLQSGSLMANGSVGAGGKVNLNIAERLIQTEGASLQANGGSTGGEIEVRAGTRVFSSASFSATGSQGKGGAIRVLGDDIALYGARIDASGKSGGGTVLVGGDFQGKNAAIPSAQTTTVNFSTSISADAKESGDGGKVIVWSDQKTEFFGKISARGGAVAGNGGFVEVSGKEDLTFGGLVDAGASHGTAGRLLLDTKNITISATAPGVASFELVAPNPDSGNQFGNMVTVLTNDNVVVSDWRDDFNIYNGGAVYLFNGKTGALISTLQGNKYNDQVGNGGVTALTNGNFVVQSLSWDNGSATDAGAVTWGSGTVGVNGILSSSNSLVGTTYNDHIGKVYDSSTPLGINGIFALTNGNFVVRSPQWNNGDVNDAGAVTWVDGTKGLTGELSSQNSLVGTVANDLVGSRPVVELLNGNYVVNSPQWRGLLGAVTWGDGKTGRTGTISGTNSLVGRVSGDRAGADGITVLTNGNYIVRHSDWRNDANVIVGAVTWGNGNAGVTGVVSPDNSLVGSKAGDQVGSHGVTALSNGNYVVLSAVWDNGNITDAGAATWGSGTAGVTGPITSANSLIGSAAGDRVGTRFTALTNGNYVASSVTWGSGKGAVTWGNGEAGTFGIVSAANSLVGSITSDGVGSSVTALTNGNYVVGSPNWRNGPLLRVGAVTWGDGTAGSKGLVSASNSLIGPTLNAYVGDGGIAALSNGNYVVNSRRWDSSTASDVGAVTWADGKVGLKGVVSAENSLIGSRINDFQNNIVRALAKGNYVVANYEWDYGLTTNAGAVTWGNGEAGTFGIVSDSNSMVGARANSRVGSGGITALTNGNYVVSSTSWSSATASGVGAVTWGDGAKGTTVGIVSATNSLVGQTASDSIGTSYDGFSTTNGVIALSNGNYVVRSSRWNNGAVVDAGAVTWGSGTTGVTGVVSLANSLVGRNTDDYVGNQPVTLLSDGNVVVPQRIADRLSFNDGRVFILLAGVTGNLPFSTSPGAHVTLTPAAITAITNTGTAVTLQANNDITLATGSHMNTANAGGDGGHLTLQAGRSILLNSNITTDNGDLTLVANETTANGVQDAYRDAGQAVITMASGTTLNAGSGNIEMRISDGAGLTNAASGDITLDSLTAAHVLVKNDGATAGSGIQRAQASSTITANSVAFDISNASNTTGAIGTAAAWMNVATSRLAARTRGGHLFLNSANAYEIGAATLGGLAGINAASGNVSLRHATGSLTQSAAITSAGLELLGTGSYLLTHGANAITTLAGNTGSVRLLNTRSLAVGTVNTEGLTSSGTVALEATGAAADLILDRAIVAGGSGNAVVLKAGSSNPAGVGSGGQFINNVGAKGIAARSGRYLVYSGDPRLTKAGTTGYSARYNTDASYTPDGTASMILYRSSPKPSETRPKMSACSVMRTLPLAMSAQTMMATAEGKQSESVLLEITGGSVVDRAETYQRIRNSPGCLVS